MRYRVVLPLCCLCVLSVGAWSDHDRVKATYKALEENLLCSDMNIIRTIRDNASYSDDKRVFLGQLLSMVQEDIDYCRKQGLTNGSQVIGSAVTIVGAAALLYLTYRYYKKSVAGIWRRIEEFACEHGIRKFEYNDAGLIWYETVKEAPAGTFAPVNRQEFNDLLKTYQRNSALGSVFGVAGAALGVTGFTGLFNGFYTKWRQSFKRWGFIKQCIEHELEKLREQ